MKRSWMGFALLLLLLACAVLTAKSKDFRLGYVKQRADQLAVCEFAGGRDAAQAVQPTSARHMKQNGLCVIVGVMSRSKKGDFVLLH